VRNGQHLPAPSYMHPRRAELLAILAVLEALAAAYYRTEPPPPNDSAPNAEGR